MVLSIPFDGSLDATFQGPLWIISEVTLGRSDIALPVALAQNVVFVLVESIHFACQLAEMATYPTNDAQEPQGSLDVENPRISHLLL